ncbi:MAG: hypothetical protein AAGA48_39870 [Myxococcota bacterium]
MAVHHDVGHARILFFNDPIEGSSYPVTETGYAMLYRAWGRALAGGGEVFLAAADPRLQTAGQASVLAQRVRHFHASPYDHYRSQRQHYDPERDRGAVPCHEPGPQKRVELNTFDVIVWRREQGPREALLQALATIEDEVLVYLSPRLALDPAFGSKQLPARLAPDAVPLSFDTSSMVGSRAKLDASLRFLAETLGQPPLAIAKPRVGDNGVGITAVTRDEPASTLTDLLARFGDLVVQEYLPSVRRPADLSEEALAELSPDVGGFGEVRFLLIDGDVPRDTAGEPFLMARRVPTDSSLLADSGISYPTRLSKAELDFVQRVGQAYRSLGIHFGGGDLIRTLDPSRPFVFTDAARSVCGHAVVTGALNGEPYGIVDRVLDSMSRQLTPSRLAIA